MFEAATSSRTTEVWIFWDLIFVHTDLKTQDCQSLCLMNVFGFDADGYRLPRWNERTGHAKATGNKATENKATENKADTKCSIFLK